MNIGEFAQLTGLSIKALRRYDEQGLLRPAVVDPGRATGGTRRRNWTPRCGSRRCARPGSGWPRPSAR
ncbi:MerR family DNA-binding transcriptional regulator [Saccharopolyspora spinosporotrichia]